MDALEIFHILLFISYGVTTIELLMFFLNVKILRSLTQLRNEHQRRLLGMVFTVSVLLATIVAVCGVLHFLSALHQEYPNHVVVEKLVCACAGLCAALSLLTACEGRYMFPRILILIDKFELNDEGKLKHTEEIMFDTLELFGESIVVLDSTGTVIKWGNGVSKDYFGNEFKNNPVTNRMHPEDVALFESMILNLSRGLPAPLIAGRTRARDAANVWQYRLSSPDDPLVYTWVESTMRQRRFLFESKELNDSIIYQGDDLSAAELDEETGLTSGVQLRRASRVLPAPVFGPSLSSRKVAPVDFEIVMITRDINERKKREELQRVVQATQEKERINEAKLRYISSVAHDLKTPLQSFSFAVDALKATGLTTDQRDILGNACISSDLMKLTILQTQDIGKLLTGGKLAPRKGTVQLSSLLKRVDVVIEGFGAQVPISYNIASDVGDYILSDEEWLWQVLLNFLTNACKYTDEGEITVSVSLQKRVGDSQARSEMEKTGEHTTLLFEVLDTGIGVSDSKMGLLFQSFSMIQEGQTQGTGLGLYGVRSRVEGLGGICGVRKNERSKTGSGSVFWFEIPYVEDTTSMQLYAYRSFSSVSSNSLTLDDSESGMPTAGAVAARNTQLLSGSECLHSPSLTIASPLPTPVVNLQNRGRSVTVEHMRASVESVIYCSNELKSEVRKKPLSAIVVDDVLTICKIMERVLRQLGFEQVECYPNGKKGLDAMMKKEVDIVFSDVQMPILSGPEMVHRFREFETGELLAGRRQCRQVIVAVTANGDEFVTDLVGSDSFDCIFPKPVNKHDIRLAVNDLLGLSIEE